MVSERVARATAGLVPGSLDWATAIDELAEELLAEDRDDGEETPLDAAIVVRRLAISRLDEDLPSTAGLRLRNNLAVDLSSRHKARGGLGDLLEACALGREVLASAPPGDRLIHAASLVGRLSCLSTNPGYQAELDDAIGLLRDALAQAGDNDRARPLGVATLAGLEVHRWRRDGDLAALTSAAEAAGAALDAGEVTGATPVVPRVLVWADTGPDDRAIPGVLDEARQVADLYPEARTRLRDRQSRARVPLRGTAPSASQEDDPPKPATTASAAADAVGLLREADIIHLACHCDVDPGQPDETVLQVDPPVRVGDMGVGVLDARSHVVLSACDAALTATSLPDEALSPAAALLLAGVGTVTAPVWPVDDEATAALMTDYHRRLAAGAEAGQALSQVQAIWSATGPPFVYAPWVVVVRPHGPAAP